MDFTTYFIKKIAKLMKINNSKIEKRNHCLEEKNKHFKMKNWIINSNQTGKASRLYQKEKKHSI